jgi:uncharacterized protein YqeY
MGLKERLDKDLENAVREQNTLRRTVLRSIRSEVHNEEIALQKPLENDESIISVISKQVKQHRESIYEFRKGQREDLIEREEAELDVLLDYLPTQLTSEEITILVQGVLQEVGASGLGDKGKVMGKLMPQVKGKADGLVVNEIVSNLLEAL